MCCFFFYTFIALVGPSIESYGKKVGQKNPFTPMTFKIKLATSVAVLALSGFGYDTYRLWETLSMGLFVMLRDTFPNYSNMHIR